MQATVTAQQDVGPDHPMPPHCAYNEEHEDGAGEVIGEPPVEAFVRHWK